MTQIVLEVTEACERVSIISQLLVSTECVSVYKFNAASVSIFSAARVEQCVRFL